MASAAGEAGGRARVVTVVGEAITGSEGPLRLAAGVGGGPGSATAGSTFAATRVGALREDATAGAGSSGAARAAAARREADVDGRVGGTSGISVDGIATIAGAVR